MLKLRSASISFPPHAQRPASITSELDCDATANRWTPTDGRSYRQVGNYQRGLSPFQNRLVVIDRRYLIPGEAQRRRSYCSAP